MNIFLIGYRCTGKTTVGKSLARALHRPFIDCDQYVVKTGGMSIAEMVRHHGWEEFRRQEGEAIARLCGYRRHVVATGGGVILDPRNVACMQKGGTLIWLRASAETIKSRIMQDQHTAESRPALTSTGVLNEIEETLKARQPLYRKAKDIVVDTDQRSIRQICRIVLDELRDREAF